ncbi:MULTISPECIES: lectin-like protein [unclassified Ruminococcus]|uniref:lectin-like protein n=1 Tax=unclassified Ruminococcus TaxID=2608920 RepID=UPI00210D23E6|nr:MULTISPECIES: lectin-like protein [unclassified Ruminococcus]MCQ4022703.1 CHAP domain-containing protein [Ruminococcus sp. zg-924]MCQ4114943.1 CHAP domain-containing protein [Ruminococcus sp. zg-921]
MKIMVKKLTSVILVFVMILGVFVFVPFSASAVTKHTQSEAVAWAKSKIGKYLDYDKEYGAQCVDLIAYYYNYLGTTTPGGNACDYTKNKLPSGWKRIKNYSGFKPQPGDIVVWDSYAKPDQYSSTGIYGHIGIVTSGNSSKFNTIEQNISGSPCKACSGRLTSNATCFIRPDFVVLYNLAYNANGGTGSMASKTIAYGATFTPSKNTFTKNGYYFSGYNVCRKSDSKWYVSGIGWQTQQNITVNGYTKAVYNNGKNYVFNSGWTNGGKAGDTFTFYPVWKPNNSILYFYPNYSGCNYIMGGSLDSNYSKYIYSRDTSIYNISVDNSQKLNNLRSLKIVAKSAGSSGHDMQIRTSTNAGRSEGSNGAYTAVGDNRKFTLTFWAKGTVNGAKMYFRWGYTPTYKYVVLTNEWKKYTVDMTKNIYSGISIHPYIDTAGTFWINNLTLCDGSNGTNNFRYEDGYNITNQTYKHGETYSKLPIPTRDGYTFLGWYTQNEGGTKITTSTKVDDFNRNVYAHWEKNINNNILKTVYDDNKKYELYDDSVTWEKAKELCEEKGGHLVTINNQHENDLVCNMISDRNCNVWIGASYNENTSEWEWVNGENFDYTNWSYDEPSSENGSLEKYVQMYSFNLGLKDTLGKWNDVNINNNADSIYSVCNSCYICEYDYLSGDINCDGKVNLLDAVYAQKVALQIFEVDEQGTANADMNGDGNITVFDALSIQKLAL